MTALITCQWKFQITNTTLIIYWTSELRLDIVGLGWGYYNPLCNKELSLSSPLYTPVSILAVNPMMHWACDYCPVGELLFTLR